MKTTFIGELYMKKENLIMVTPKRGGPDNESGFDPKPPSWPSHYAKRASYLALPRGRIRDSIPLYNIGPK